MRIGELAREAGTTPRTVREYDETDVARLRELLRLKSMLGLSLDELKSVMSGEDARARRRREYRETEDPVQRRRILLEGKAHTDALIALVQRRRADLEGFEAELNERRQQQVHLLRELGERV